MTLVSEWYLSRWFLEQSLENNLVKMRFPFPGATFPNFPPSTTRGVSLPPQPTTRTSPSLVPSFSLVETRPVSPDPIRAPSSSPSDPDRPATLLTTPGTATPLRATPTRAPTLPPSCTSKSKVSSPSRTRVQHLLPPPPPPPPPSSPKASMAFPSPLSLPLVVPPPSAPPTTNAGTSTLPFPAPLSHLTRPRGTPSLPRPVRSRPTRAARSANIEFP